MQKYYLDTSIWRDYYENRSDNIRPLGEWGFEFIKLVITNKDKIIVSDLVIDELKIKYSDKEIEDIFSIVPDDFFEYVEVDKMKYVEAKLLNKILRVGVGDIIHALIAKENKAILITRDKHFMELIHIVEIRKPEELL